MTSEDDLPTPQLKKTTSYQFCCSQKTTKILDILGTFGHFDKILDISGTFGHFDKFLNNFEKFGHLEKIFFDKN